MHPEVLRIRRVGYQEERLRELQRLPLSITIVPLTATRMPCGFTAVVGWQSQVTTLCATLPKGRPYIRPG